MQGGLNEWMALEGWCTNASRNPSLPPLLTSPFPSPAGLEAVNVILNLAETSEGDLCDDNDGKDSIYLFDNLNGRFQKLAGSKPGLVVMKKRSKAPSSGLDDRGDPEQGD
jgi:hypothetical protein